LDGDNTAPVICYDEYTLAPSGMTIIDDDSHEWHGDMFVAGLRANHVQRIKNVDSSHGDLKNEIFYFPENDLVSNRIRNVEYYNGSLWVFGDERGLAQISPK